MFNEIHIIAQNHPDRIALQDEHFCISYGAIEQEIEKRLDALQDVSVLAIALDNSVNWVLWDLAALKAGIPCVPVPPFFSSEQLAHLLQSAGVSHLLSPQGLRGIGREGKNTLPAGTAKVTYTSGTTGLPKGVCLPQSAMENVARSIVNVLGNEFVGTHACVLPLAVLLENVAGVYAGLMAGCTIQLTALKSFGEAYENIFDVLHYASATSAIFVPEILRTLMAQVTVKGFLKSLKFLAVGGSKVDPGMIIQAHKMGLPAYEGYGLSECASVVSLNTPRDFKPGTVGEILPHISVQIENGEIKIKNPGFLGYVDEKAPAVFSTGDLGYIDGDGFLSVTGRKKNMLITSYGRNISPEWPESVLLAQPEIIQAVVYGDSKPHLGALIVPRSEEADIESAVSKANQNLPDYARINVFQLVPPFTVADGLLTGTGRPRREDIFNLYLKKEKKNEFLQSAS